MAERQSAKREEPEGGRTSEAEAKPSDSAATSLTKRIKMEEKSEGSPVADSTTASIHDVHVEQVPTRGSISEVDQTSTLPSRSESQPVPQDGEDGPSSTSCNEISHQNKTVEDLLPADSSEYQPTDHSDNSEVVSSFLVDGDPSGIPHAGFKNGVRQAAERLEVSSASVAESSASYVDPHKDDSQRSSHKGDDASNSHSQELQVDSALITSEGKDGIPHPARGASCEKETAGASDGQEVAGLRGEGIEADTATQRQPLTGLKEVDVGIVEYISKHKGFHGVIKQRYQDFLVNEVDIEGKIVHLTDMSCPDPKVKSSINIDEVLSAHDQQRLRELVEATDKIAFHCIEAQNLDKEQRTKVHEVIRQDFGTLESGTLDGDGKKVIKVTKVTRGGRKQRSIWDKSRPNFCRFVMHKENMEVNDALTLISKYLHVKHQSFGFSGTKDKRAITVQEVTVYRVEAERLNRLNGILRGIRFGNFRYVKEALTLGDHAGNHFVIVLRDVDAPLVEIDQALTSMRDVGFINYFGMQRFGNSQVATHLVGRALLHSNWQEAVDLILKPREGNTQDNRWRQLWVDTRDPKVVMDALPKHKTIAIEMQLLKGLQESKNNYFVGLQCIPRNVRLLYVHSYQSFVWNLMTTRRIQKYGLKVISGDLILKENKPGDESEHLQSSVVDDSHLDSYSIQDVVLPMPGYAVQYPQNEVGDWYRDLLHSHGLDIKRMRHQVKDFSLSGTYRKIIVKPDHISWSLLPYSNATIPLAQSDLDRLEGKESPAIEPDGNLRALRLEFTLTSSCYATMAIREVLKIDTSAAHQSALNPNQQRESDNTSTETAEVHA